MLWFIEHEGMIVDGPFDSRREANIALQSPEYDDWGPGLKVVEKDDDYHTTKTGALAPWGGDWRGGT